MSANKTVLLVSAILLRVGVILFVFSQLVDIWMSIESGSDFWDYFLLVVLLLIFVGLSIITLALDKTKFEVFGFFLVLIGCVFSIFHIIITKGIQSELSTYFLLITVSIYFIIKSKRSNRKRAVNVFE
ncbi:MAG: hypothetical protein ACOYMF_07480 [Bacteroidales bacterium]